MAISNETNKQVQKVFEKHFSDPLRLRSFLKDLKEIKGNKSFTKSIDSLVNAFNEEASDIFKI